MIKKKTILNFNVSEVFSERTLISFLKKKLKGISLSLIYKLFRENKVEVNGKKINYFHYRLSFGEKIKIIENLGEIKKEKEINIKKKYNLERIKEQILYEDANILIFLKESGFSMPELDEMINYYFFIRDNKKYNELLNNFFTFTSVHRLDMLTKGLIIYPKNQIAKKILYNAIGDKEKVKKEYLAFCENNLSKKRFPSGLITGFISKNNEKKRMNFFPAKSSDKPTIKNTKFCSMVVKREFKNNVYSLFSIILHTGRKHQIRSMFSFFKLPIIGDKKYGSQIEKKNKIFLFAYKISFFFLPFPLNYLNNKTFQFKLKKGFK